MKIKISMLCVALSVFPLLVQAGTNNCTINEQGFQNISGEYVCTTACSAPGFGGRAFINQQGNTLKFINGAGSVSSGTLTPYGIWVVDWSLNATVANNCQEIIFSNNSVWLRK
ncbi:MAG: hypothetical protein WCI11_16650 [Candidatus Methylumidiphilus sp.]